MKSYIAKSYQEAKILHDLKEGEEAKIWIPCKVQPAKEGMKICTLMSGSQKKEGWHFWTLLAPDGYSIIEHGEYFPKPLAINIPIYVRETWAIKGWLNAKEVFAYKSDGGVCPEIRFEGEEFGGQWQSPATMPKDAARTWITPVSVEVKRVQEVKSYEAAILGFDSLTAFDNDFKKRYPDVWKSNHHIFLFRIKKSTT